MSSASLLVWLKCRFNLIGKIFKKEPVKSNGMCVSHVSRGSRVRNPLRVKKSSKCLCRVPVFDWVIIAVLMTNSMQLPLCQVGAIAQKGIINIKFGLSKTAVLWPVFKLNSKKKPQRQIKREAQSL
ncbi:hypothetical protein BpHYR1_042338 [Brachionus plicatilis]|uniref:Uncharacterized protein n=1 Tax=Brachionus plicatilis TaxID=10195 RepID=A0A3M7SUV2_BRAPC|nr:hypothetical protein BpHYR1_042338 [Brachionus plicatilis]